MKFRFRTTLTVFPLILLLASGLQAQEPDWVKSPPIVREYYIGIGSAKKMGKSHEYAEAAKNDALRALASEITVNISGEFIHNLAEQSGMVEQEIKSTVQATTKAELEGYELVDKYEDANHYYVYYRLSKGEYARRKVNKLRKATSASLDFFNKAKNAEQQGQLGNAVSFYMQAIAPIQNHLDDPLNVDWNGREIFLMNEIYSSLQGLFNGLQFNAINSPIGGKVGMPLKKPLMLKVVYGQSSPVGQLPVKFSFTRGSGELIEQITTSSSGEAYCRVSKVSATDKMQMISAEIDVDKLLYAQASPVIRGIVKNLGTPGTKFILNIEGITAFITVSENHFDGNAKMLYIEPKLKNVMTQRGFNFTTNMAKADIMLDLKAASRQGSEFSGMYSAYVDLNISVTDMGTGSEIYKASKTGIKGMQLSYDKAGVKAFENAGKELGKLIDQMIEKIQK